MQLSQFVFVSGTLVFDEIFSFTREGEVDTEIFIEQLFQLDCNA